MARSGHRVAGGRSPSLAQVGVHHRCRRRRLLQQARVIKCKNGASLDASAGAGAGRAYGAAPGRRRSGKVGPARYGDSKTQRAVRERSASTHAMQMQNGKLRM
eukprot:6196832-Pleurochrysis_carterae.AAC.2